MSDIVLKSSMSLGTGTAENDGEFLTECFVNTPEYESLIDFSDRKMILLGRTGAGKTALLRRIQKDVDVYIVIRPDTFALQYVSNIPFVLALKEEGINLEIFYKFLWLHEIMSQIIKQYFSYNRKDFFAILTEHIKNPSRISQMSKYLCDFEGVFFDERSAETITNQIEKNIGAEVGFNTFARVRGSLTETQKKEIQTKASQYVNRTQITQLKNIISILKEYMGENKQRNIFVAIDDLDQNWIEENTKYQLISALLDAVRLFVDVPNLKIVLAMRADLLSKTCSEMKRQNEKDMAFTLKLNWNKKMLADLLDTRVSYLFRHKYQKKYDVTFFDICNCQVKGEDAADYLIRRTMMRPRDIISFVNLCIVESDSETTITSSAILRAEETFRYDRTKSIEYEWINNYPLISTYISILYTFPNTFTLDEVFSKYGSIESALLSKNQDSDFLVRAFLDTKDEDVYHKEQNLKQFLNILFILGLIGRRVNETTVFSSPNQPELCERDYCTNLVFTIHPLFMKSE